VRVIHVAPTQFGPEGLFGGGERYPLELARALAADVECELVTFGREAKSFRDPSGLHIRVLRALTHLRGHPAQPVARGIARALEDADVVHTHHTRTAPSRVAAVAARSRGHVLATTDHGFGGGGWWGLLPRLFHRFLAVSRYSAQVLGVPANRTRVIYGGVDPDRFTLDPSVPRTGVLFLGRVTPHKGVDRLIEALPRGTELRIAGSSGHDPRPPERDYPRFLGRLAAGRPVTFLGAVPDDQTPELLRSAAVVAIPSVQVTCYGRYVPISELLSLTALEAMACGTPVVASRIGGLPEVVRDGETGFLVEPGHRDELRDRLRELLGNGTLRKRLGAAGRELVLERFTWPRVARRCLDAYQELR
jgi:glycosyltransferase involved in cell wall biosynthesis